MSQNSDDNQTMVSFRLPADAVATIEALAGKAGMSRSEYLRARALSVSEDTPSSLEALLRHLIYITNRIHIAVYSIAATAGLSQPSGWKQSPRIRSPTASNIWLSCLRSWPKSRLESRHRRIPRRLRRNKGGLAMAFGASEAARWQAYQTRARMGAHLWFQIITITVLGWVVLTFYVVWRQTGVFYPQLDHQYFWYWVLCGIVIDTPLLDLCAANLKVPAPGGWYPLLEFTAWLNGPQLYHLPFTTWFVHYGARTALVPLGLGAVAIAWRARHHLDVEHLRGLRLLGPREHNRQLSGGRLPRLRSRRRRGIRLGASIVPEAKECEHFLITGSPGAGKSTLIRHMLAQVEERRQSAIVIDPDCEFIQEFYDEARGDVVLNPLDARCPFWSPWLEFRADCFAMDAEAMAASLIRSQARTPTEEFFRESGRTLIESAFTVIRDRNDARSLLDFFSLPRQEIHQELAGTRAYPLIDPGAHEQGSGILATAANAIKYFTISPHAIRATVPGVPVNGRRPARAGSSYHAPKTLAQRFRSCKACGWIAWCAG